ncbi:MAG TPA: hypothetical protein VF450_00330 [Noviherbaspirillum sp.]
MKEDEREETKSLMIRPSVSLLRWYETRAAELQLKQGIKITANKLMVHDLETIKAKAQKGKGDGK